MAQSSLWSACMPMFTKLSRQRHGQLGGESRRKVYAGGIHRLAPTLVTTAKVTFSMILRRARRASCRRGARQRRSLVNRATSAASMAMAEPAGAHEHVEQEEELHVDGERMHEGFFCTWTLEQLNVQSGCS